MPLTDQQLEKLQDHLHAGGRSITCSVCGNSHWSAQFVVAAPKFSNGNATFDESLPMIPISCNNCGRIILFSAVTALGEGNF